MNTTGSIDRSRYFENPYRANDIITPFSPEECLANANLLLTKCQACYGNDAKRLEQPHCWGTLYHGALGATVFLPWKIARLHQTTLGNLQESNRLLQEALQAVDRAVAVCATPSHRSRRPRVTLLESPYFGARAMQIVIWNDLGMTSKAVAEADHLIERELSEACRVLLAKECDVLYGRAGALQVILFLRQCLGNDEIGKTTALQLADEICQEGLRYAARDRKLGLPLLWEWHETQYLGSAHGVVGILHTLLCLHANELAILNERYNIHEKIKQTIQALNLYALPSGNLDSSIKAITRTGRTDRLVHWCHGAPGHILLLIKGYEVYKEDSLKQHAIQLADDIVWKRGLLRKGIGLCHGISGNAYPLLAIARVMDDSSIRRSMMTARAHAFARFGLKKLDELEGVPDAPYSVYNGLGGLCTLFLDLLVDGGVNARFPLYDFA